MAALLSSFLKDFRESFIPYCTHPANSGSESAKELPLLKMPPNEKFSSADVDFSP
jgi:hypothetical protein